MPPNERLHSRFSLAAFALVIGVGQMVDHGEPLPFLFISLATLLLLVLDYNNIIRP